MTFSESKIKAIKDHLSQEFWSGKRWISFNSAIWQIGPKDFKCFVDYQAATNYCEEMNRKGKNYFIKALAPVLRVLNKGLPQQISATEIKDIQTALDLYPISFFEPIALVKMCLYHEEYIPVIWTKPINPLSQIEFYHIVQVKGESNVQRKGKVLFSFSEIRKAFEKFNRLAKGPANDSSKAAIIIYGQYYERIFNPNNFDLTDKNTGLHMYKAIPNLIKEAIPYYTIEQVHDPTSPIKIEQTMFVKYNLSEKQLVFYDESLKKVTPGQIIDPINCKYFYFGLLK